MEEREGCVCSCSLFRDTWLAGGWLPRWIDIMEADKIYWTNSVCYTLPSRNLLLPPQVYLRATFQPNECRAEQSRADSWRWELTSGGTDGWTAQAADGAAGCSSPASSFWWDLFINTICRDWIWQAIHNSALVCVGPRRRTKWDKRTRRNAYVGLGSVVYSEYPYKSFDL